MRTKTAEIAAPKAESDGMLAGNARSRANANAGPIAERTSADEFTDKESRHAAETDDAASETARDSVQRRGQARGFIAELIQSLPQGTHLTAGEVFERVQQAGLNLSLSTIYRTLGS